MRTRQDRSSTQLQGTSEMRTYSSLNGHIRQNYGAADVVVGRVRVLLRQSPGPRCSAVAATACPVREVGARAGRGGHQWESIAEPRAERVGGDRGWLLLEDRARDRQLRPLLLEQERQRTPRTRRRPRFLRVLRLPCLPRDHLDPRRDAGRALTGGRFFRTDPGRLVAEADPAIAAVGSRRPRARSACGYRRHGRDGARPGCEQAIRNYGPHAVRCAFVTAPSVGTPSSAASSSVPASLPPLQLNANE